MTANETHAKIEQRNGRTNKPSITPCFKKLERHGVIRDLGTRICLVTGRNCYYYDVTSNMPIELDEPKQRRIFWVVFSEKSGGMGYASPDKSDVETTHAMWKTKPRFDDAKIFKAQVVKPE